MIVNKSTLFIEEIENVHVGGYIKRPLTRVRFDIDIIGNITYKSEPPVRFPLNVGDNWFVDQTSILLHYFANFRVCPCGHPYHKEEAKRFNFFASSAIILLTDT